MNSRIRFLVPIAAAIVLSVCHHAPIVANSAPETPSKPVAPSIARELDTIRAAVTAHDSDGDSIACQFAWGEGDSAFTPYSTGADSFRAWRIWYTPGVKNLRVRALDTHRAFSDWSEATTITIPDQPPVADSIQIPSQIETGKTTENFAAYAHDPDGNVMWSQFEWGDGDTTEWISAVSNDLPARSVHRWVSGGSYTVKERVTDGVDTSDWSAETVVNVNGPVLAWRYPAVSQTRTTPAIGPEGTIYFASSDGSIHALNPDGTPKWQSATALSSYGSVALGADGTIYSQTKSSLYALNPDGTNRWTRSLSRSPSNYELAVAFGPDGTIYSSGYELYALNPNDSLKWSYHTHRPHSSPVVSHNGTVYYTANDGSLTALYPDSTLYWQHSLPGASFPPPPSIGGDGTVYSVAEGILHAVNPDSTFQWDCLIEKSSDNGRAQPVIGPDGTIYVGSEHYMAAVAHDGTLLWEVPVEGKLPTTAAVDADGTVYCGDYEGLLALNPDGTKKWRYWTNRHIQNGPTIAPDGTVYFGCDDWYLYALKGSAPLANSPWPKFQRDLQNSGQGQ